MTFKNSWSQKIFPNEHELQREIRYPGEFGDNLDYKASEGRDGLDFSSRNSLWSWQTFLTWGHFRLCLPVGPSCDPCDLGKPGECRRGLQWLYPPMSSARILSLSAVKICVQIILSEMGGGWEDPVLSFVGCWETAWPLTTRCQQHLPPPPAPSQDSWKCLQALPNVPWGEEVPYPFSIEMRTTAIGWPTVPFCLGPRNFVPWGDRSLGSLVLASGPGRHDSNCATSPEEILVWCLVVSLSDRLLLGIVGCVTVYIVRVTAAVGTNLIPFSFAALINHFCRENFLHFTFSDKNDLNNDVLWGSRGLREGL